jgi:acyl-coenzyme A thioesterase PaaI-like protein
VDVVASPILQGRVQQLWSVELTRHDDHKLVAQGRLRLQNVPIPTPEA